MSAIHDAIEALVEGRPLGTSLLGDAMGEIMDGAAKPVAAAALLIALRMKGETIDEIVAVARALRARATSVAPSDPKTVDTCGTGGSGLDTFNISTTSAFVVAGAGVSVAKHGNRAATSRSGSFDVLEALGIRIDLPIETYAKILDEIGIAPFFARTAHPAYRHIAPVRAELRVRTLLNCLGPLLSPVGAKYQVVGVYSPKLVEPLAEALGELGAVRALVVHGNDGMDELTTTTSSVAALVANGRTQRMEFTPESLGLGRVPLSELVGGDALENAVTTHEILEGKQGPQRDIVLLNSAAALWVVEAAATMEEGIALAQESIDSGAAAGKLEALAAATQNAGSGP